MYRLIWLCLKKKQQKKAVFNNQLAVLIIFQAKLQNFFGFQLLKHLIIFFLTYSTLNVC